MINNFSDKETLPSVSNCKFSLSDNIEVAKKSLFSSKGLSESIVLKVFLFYLENKLLSADD